MAELRPHYIDVDLKKNTQYNVPVVTQNDTATHFIIRVTDDGLSDPELLDAYQEITMTSQRPDGESFYLTGTRIPGTNEIEFHLGTDETAFSGSVLASLQFYLVEDASRYTSAQFRYDVKKDLTTNYTPTQREETLVEVVLKEGPGVIQEAKDAKIAVDGALVELEQDKTAAIERLDEVTEENKTIFREPVATFATLSTTYPNPENGTTVRVTGESSTYRYSDGSWVKTDEYNPTAIDQVTAQLAEKAEKLEVEGTNSRIDNLILESGGDSNLEVTDARTSIAKNKIYPTLSSRILDVEKDSFVPIKNSVKNGNFKDNGAGWLSSAGTSSWSSGTVILTGNGSASNPALYQAITIPLGHTIYIATKTRAKTPGIPSIRIRASSGLISGSVNAPVVDNWYFLSAQGKITNSDNIGVQIFNADASVSNGLKIEVDSIMLIDLTETFGVGEEPTKDEIEALLNTLPDKWFDGTTSLATIKSLYEEIQKLKSTPSSSITEDDVVNQINDYMSKYMTDSNQPWEVN